MPAIYIEWDVKEMEFVEVVYVGDGEHDQIFKEVTVTKSALYSHTVSPEMVDRAEEYIETDMEDRRVAGENPRVVIK